MLVVIVMLQIMLVLVDVVKCNMVLKINYILTFVCFLVVEANGCVTSCKGNIECSESCIDDKWYKTMYMFVYIARC